MRPDVQAGVLRVAKLREEGHSYEAISKQLGITQSKVGRYIRIAKDKKLLPCTTPVKRSKRIVGLARYKNIQMGSMTQIFGGLSEQEAVWLLDSLPEDMTVAEYVASIVSDAYHEETDT